ncbi:MAG: hypothetical protein NVS2B14_00260 [Chamaesiphon sp.]
MGEAKRRKALDPSFGKIRQKDKDLTRAFDDFLSFARSDNWVCYFGNDFVAVGTLDHCFSSFDASEAEIKSAKLECLLTGQYLGDLFEIEWNDTTAANFRQRYSFFLNPDNSLCIAP